MINLIFAKLSEKLLWGYVLGKYVFSELSVVSNTELQTTVFGDEKYTKLLEKKVDNKMMDINAENQLKW